MTVSDLPNVSVGDVLYQNASTFSIITALDFTTNEITVQNGLLWSVGAVQVLKAFSCDVTWKQIFGDNPAFVRQFSEGLALFKNAAFVIATFNFATDFDKSSEPVTIYGAGNGLWGQFSWDVVSWGSPLLPSNIRFLIPQNKQIASYLIPSMNIRQGYSNFKFQGLGVSYNNISFEVSN